MDSQPTQSKADKWLDSILDEYDKMTDPDDFEQWKQEEDKAVVKSLAEHKRLKEPQREPKKKEEVVDIIDKRLELLAFYQALFKDCSGFIELRFIKPNAGILVQWLDIEKQLLITKFPIDDIMNNNKNGYNVYHGACPREQKECGRRDMIKQVPALWCDIDFKTLEKGKETAHKNLKALPEEMKPSIVMASGNGYHCYWLLDAVYNINNPDDAGRIERTIQSIALLLEGDTKVKDVPRILRSPCTNNTKDPDNIKPTELLKFEPERRFPLQVLIDFFKSAEHTVKGATKEENKAFQQIEKKNENWVERALDGVGEGQRDDMAIKLASYYLVRKELPINQVRKILQNWALRCNPPYPWNEIERVIQSAKKYEQQKTIDVDAPRIMAIDTRNTDPKYYIVRLDSGSEFGVDGDVLNSWSGIQKAYLNAVNRSMATWMTAQKWHKYMDGHLRNTRYIDAPEDASDDFVIYQYIKENIENQKPATTLSEIRQGKTLIREVEGREVILFRGEILAGYMDRLNKQIPQRKLMQIVEKYGGGTARVAFGGKTNYLWYIEKKEE